MRIFNLQEWKSLWNLGKEPKSYYSVQKNLSSSNLTTIPRYGVQSHSSYPGYSPDVTDSQYSQNRVSRPQEPRRRGGSLPSSARRGRRDPDAQVVDLENRPGPNPSPGPGPGPQDRHVRQISHPAEIAYPTNGMVDIRERNGRPEATSTPVSQQGLQYNGRETKPMHGKADARVVEDEFSSDEVSSAKFASVQKHRAFKSGPEKQVGLAESSWYRSRSQKDLADSSGDLAAETERPYNKQTHADNRPLAKGPPKSWNRAGNESAAATSTRTVEIINSRYNSPAKRSQTELQQDLDNDTQSGTAKFNQALNKFRQLAEAASPEHSRAHSGSQTSERSSGLAPRAGPVEPYNAPLRDKFNSQQNVTEQTRVSERYKSAAALPTNETAPGQPRDEEFYGYPTSTVSTATRSGGVAIQKRDSLYRRANSSGLPEHSSNAESSASPTASGSFQRYHARPARVIGATHSSSSGSNLALLGLSPTPRSAATHGHPASGLSADNLNDSPDDGPVTSTPRQSGRKTLRPMTKSRESLHSRRERDHNDEWQQEDILIRRHDESDFGFIILGGRGQEIRSKDEGVYVADVTPDGAAAVDGRLKVGDLIVTANGRDFTSVSHEEAKHIIVSARDSLVLTVRRYVGKVHVVQVNLMRNGDRLGFAVTGGSNNQIRDGDTSIYIKKVFDNTVAARSGAIEVGDQLYAVNGINLVNVPHDVATDALRNASDPVTLVIGKTARINPLIFANQRL